MSKCKLPALTLDDLVRIFEALPLMLQVCKAVDDLDWCVGYELHGEENHRLLDRAQETARKALKKLEGGGS